MVWPVLGWRSVVGDAMTSFYQQVGARCLDQMLKEHSDTLSGNHNDLANLLAESEDWPCFFRAAMEKSMRTHAGEQDFMNLIAIDFFLYGLLVGSMTARAIMKEQQLNEMTEV
jgi:hypothetical protein